MGRKRNRLPFILIPAVLALLAAAALILTQLVIPKRRYEEAMALLEAGEYEAAYALLREAGREDAVAASLMERADELLEAGEPDAAYALLGDGAEEAVREKRMGIKRRQIDETKVGRSFTLGRYEQDNNRKNGPEPIRWVVLAREGDRVLVISRYVLDCKLYDEERKSVTWETCTLRAWLNGEFLNAAFDPDEQALIRMTRVTADPNPEYDVDPGADVEDKLFLLSVPEAVLYFLPDVTGIPKWKVYEQSYPELLCQPTAYSAARGCAPQSENGAARWWLRTPGLSASSASWVSRTGGIHDQGTMVNCENSLVVPGIRPVMWIGLEADEKGGLTP